MSITFKKILEYLERIDRDISVELEKGITPDVDLNLESARTYAREIKRELEEIEKDFNLVSKLKE